VKTVRLLLPAEHEMLDAARYYQIQAHGLGEEFLRKVELALQDIAANPERWPVAGSEVRRRLIHRFPYAVLYRVDATEVVVLAIAHLRRRPEYWVQR
jgi:plasmid stabilization system protein ParE